jgi:hypothetical protein
MKSAIGNPKPGALCPKCGKPVAIMFIRFHGGAMVDMAREYYHCRSRGKVIRCVLRNVPRNRPYYKEDPKCRCERSRRCR